MVLRYRDFRIDIVPARGESFVVRASAPDRFGEGRSSFIPPFGPQEEGLLARSLLRAAGRHFEPEGGERPAWSLEEIGDRLSSALFQGEVLLLYRQSLDLLAHDPTLGLRLELRIDPRDPHVASLQDLPWELLRQPGTPEYLALSRRQPFVRYLTVPRIVRAAARPRPLRILAVAASPRGLPVLDLARERRNLSEAVGKAGGSIEIVDVEPPTFARLREVLLEQECHVLHFMGHGGSLPGRDEKALFFETKNRLQHPVSGTDLVNKLADFPSLRLAVLNACDSAAVPDVDPFSGVASSLVLGGLPAVVAMRLPVSDPAAIAFSKALYRQIAAGDPVDAAVAEGRQAIHSEGLPGAEWATPVLFMRTPGGELFPKKLIVPSVLWKRFAAWTAAAVVLILLSTGAWVKARHLKAEHLTAEGLVFAEHDQWPLAHDRFVQAAKLDPGSAEVISNLAGAQEKRGYLKEAEKNYQRAVRLSPDSAEHLYNLGHFLNGQGNYREAYQSLESAVRWDPKRVDAYGELAFASLHLGLLDDARGALKTALWLDPERPALYRRLGEVELTARNPREAIAQLDEALRREPLGQRGRIETVSLLVQAYDRLADQAEACRQIAEFRHLDPAGATQWAPKVSETAARNGCRWNP